MSIFDSPFDSPDCYQKYKPVWLGSWQHPQPNYYILGMSPYSFDDDHYYEIHIKTLTESGSLNNLAGEIGGGIFIDFLSNNRLEVYVGEDAGECSSDGDTAYTSYEYRRTLKANSILWKAKTLQLRDKYWELNKIQRVPYHIIRERISDAYQRIYNAELQNCSVAEREMINQSNLFRFYLYRLFQKGHGDTYSYYVDRAFHPWLKPYKDWKMEYMDLQAKYDHLEALDMSDAASIKEHAIQLLQESFDFQSNMLRTNRYYKNGIDEHFYNSLFATLLEKLAQEEV